MKKILLLCVGLGCGLICLDAPNVFAMNVEGQGPSCSQTELNNFIEGCGVDVSYIKNGVVDWGEACTCWSDALSNAEQKNCVNIAQYIMFKVWEKCVVSGGAHENNTAEIVSVLIDEHGFKVTPVMLKEAIRNNRVEIVKRLIEPMKKYDIRRDYLLKTAIENDSSDVFEWLMRYWKIKPNQNLLNIAIKSGSDEITKYLIENSNCVFYSESVAELLRRGKTELADLLDSKLKMRRLRVSSSVRYEKFMPTQVSEAAQSQLQSNIVGMGGESRNGNAESVTFAETNENHAGGDTREPQPIEPSSTISAEPNNSNNGADDEIAGAQTDNNSDSAGSDVAVGIEENHTSGPAAVNTETQEPASAQGQQVPPQTDNQGSIEELRALLAKHDVTDYDVGKASVLYGTFGEMCSDAELADFVGNLLRSNLTEKKIDLIKWILEKIGLYVKYGNEQRILEILVKKREGTFNKYDLELVKYVLNKNNMLAVEKYNGGCLYEIANSLLKDPLTRLYGFLINKSQGDYTVSLNDFFKDIKI